MANPFETPPGPPVEKPVQKPEEAKEEEKKEETAFLRAEEITKKISEEEKVEEVKEAKEEEKVEESKEEEKTEEAKEEERIGEAKEEKTEEEPEKEEEKEISLQDLEKNLEEKRNVYIEADKEYREKFGKMKKKELAAFEEAIESARKYIKVEDIETLKDEKSPQYSEAVKRKEDFIEELTKKGIKKEKAEAIYNVELKKAEYDEAKKELGRKMLAESKNEAEIFQKLILEEREILNKAKIESWPPKEKSLLRRGLDWYIRQGTATRLLISTGLVTGVVAATGGFSAPAIALFAGQRYLKGAIAVLSGKLIGKGIDWIWENKIRAKQEAALSKLKGEFSLENLKKVDKEYEKLLEEVAGKRRKKLIVKAGVMAATGAGTAIGLSLLGGPVFAAPKTEALESKVPPSSKAPTGGITPEAKAPVAEVSGIETAKPGDSIWRMAERQLEARYGEKFTSLDEARKTYVIDTIKDKVAENPGKFGLTDIDEIKIGQKVDFSSIFEDKTEIDKFFERANALTEFQTKNILHNNEVLRNWVREHPGQKLTSENVEEILTKGKVIPDEAVTEAKTPSVEVIPKKTEIASEAKTSPVEVIPGTEATPKAEVTPTEAPPEEAPSKEDIKLKVMDANEKIAIMSFGFTEEEYEVIKNCKVRELLEQIPPNRNEAWANWEEGKINLPHYGVYESSEFTKHIRLAEYIRSFNPSETREITVRQFLRMVGPKGTISI